MTAAPTSLPTTPGASGSAYRWRWLVLAIVITAEAMDLLDATIVNLAATAIERDLGGGSSTVQWSVGAYTLAFAVMLVLGGRLGDKLGRKNLFVAGALGFTLASLGCGLAQDASALIAARAVQGLLGALLIPQGLGIMKQVFPAEEMGKAFAMFGPVIGLSAVAGPLLGGALVDADLFGLGWRTIFLINVPIGIATTLSAIRFVPESSPDRQVRLDPLGVGLLTAACLLLVLPLIQGRELGWPWWTFVLVGASAPAFAFFARHERRSDAPLIQPSLLRNQVFLSGVGVITLSFGALVGFMLVFNVFTQAALGFSPLEAAFAGCGYAVGMGIAAALGSGLVDRHGRRALWAGFAIMLLGVGGMALTVQVAGLAAQPWQFIPAGLVFGAGGGLAVVPVFALILSGVDDGEVGSASGVLTALQQFGGTLGVAVAGTVFFERMAHGAVPAVETSMLVAGGFLVGAAVLARGLRQRPRVDDVRVVERVA